jgi:hypothetical protein
VGVEQAQSSHVLQAAPTVNLPSTGIETSSPTSPVDQKVTSSHKSFRETKGKTCQFNCFLKMGKCLSEVFFCLGFIRLNNYRVGGLLNNN